MEDRGTDIASGLKDKCTSEKPPSGELKVPFARCTDGVSRHVSRVTLDEDGPFTCLGCKETLLLRIGQILDAAAKPRCIDMQRNCWLGRRP